MRPRPLFRRPILAVAVLATAACGSVGRSGPEPGSRGRAVVVYAADREADARLAAERLTGLGLVVTQEREGPPVRERSSVAVYRIAREDSILEPVRAALADVPGLEWLPSVHGGPPLTDVVVWLVSADRDAAAASAEE